MPRIYWEQTSPQVLTMEYTPGTKINQVAELDAKGVDRKLLAKRAVESYLQQLLTYGFFHAGIAKVLHAIRQPSLRDSEHERVALHTHVSLEHMNVLSCSATLYKLITQVEITFAARRL